MQRYGKNQYQPNITTILFAHTSVFLTFVKESPQSLILVKTKEKTAFF